MWATSVRMAIDYFDDIFLNVMNMSLKKKQFSKTLPEFELSQKPT